MSNTTPITVRGWIEQAQQDGYIWAEKALKSITEPSLNFPCFDKDRAMSLVAMYTGVYPDGWRHYRTDRIEHTGVYWIRTEIGGATLAVLSLFGGAYNPVTGIGFDPRTILYFHEINPPAGPEM